MDTKGEDIEEDMSSYMCVLCVWGVSRNWGNRKDVSGASEAVTSTNGKDTRNGLLLSPPWAEGLDHE